jgi:hypothetical protein
MASVITAERIADLFEYALGWAFETPAEPREYGELRCHRPSEDSKDDTRLQRASVVTRQILYFI